MGGSSSIQVPGGGTEGYHVLRVQQNSPGFCAGLEPFFDFIISVCDTRLNKDSDTLKALLERNAERPVKMLLYSIKTLAVREAAVTPSSMWEGRGLLGISIRFSSFQGARENVWHVLEVEPNSPAAVAGLQANTDYIIGADTFLDKMNDLSILIESNEGRQLKLHVYSTHTGDCREVLITPNRCWGGEGSLGCGIGYGYLHRVPTTKHNHFSPPGDEALTAVVATLPVTASTEQAGAACSDPFSDLISVRTDADVHADPLISSHCDQQPSIHPAATPGHVEPSTTSHSTPGSFGSCNPSMEKSNATKCQSGLSYNKSENIKDRRRAGPKQGGF
ncbi:Golgi reassembly-stacking protein 2-like isoform X2 [Dunckerocampus dactyliophorus]|uniref:Golgi reassembly-stacking protein 2-like isoform X2 n=1 Tax=Dunckerocampus dactyliophorus TaxID=161453 RepID=UPI002404E0B0|nr:Golgi reassembly-stacking protein 2-like isoform X2 [Dunckerocampus dactyliophorus]